MVLTGLLAGVPGRLGVLIASTIVVAKICCVILKAGTCRTVVVGRTLGLFSNSRGRLLIFSI
jgi:hypothetical protein